MKNDNGKFELRFLVADINPVENKLSATKTILAKIEPKIIEGQITATFTDHETGQEYVISNNPFQSLQTVAWGPIYQFEQSLVAGIVYPENTFGDLPILWVIQAANDQRILEATTAEQFTLPTVPRAEPVDGEVENNLF